jgi:hypothetical protein
MPVLDTSSQPSWDPCEDSARKHVALLVHDAGQFLEGGAQVVVGREWQRLQIPPIVDQQQRALGRAKTLAHPPRRHLDLLGEHALVSIAGEAEEEHATATLWRRRLRKAGHRLVDQCPLRRDVVFRVSHHGAGAT